MLIPQGYRKYEYFAPTPTFQVRAATTANGTLASAFDNASVIDGITLVTGDFILVKNQTTQSDNGVYVVQASGAPVRHTSFNTYLELNDASVSVTLGTINTGTDWYQNTTLTSLSSNQVWTNAPNVQKFVVPDYTNRILVGGAGGGGGGGGGGGNTPGIGGEGGTGGEGCLPRLIPIDVVPGDILSIAIGAGGLGGAGGSGVPGTAGSDGGDTTVTGSGVSLTFKGGIGGYFGSDAPSATPRVTGPKGGAFKTYGGDGGGGSTGLPTRTGTDGDWSPTAAGGAPGVALEAGSGGGGGAGYGAGGTGGNSRVGDFGLPGSAGGISAGGGGGAGGGDALGTTSGAEGGRGGPGYVIFWTIE